MTEKLKLENNYASVNAITAKEIENPNCITGDTNYLLPRLKESFKKAVSIDIIVAFLMESGVKLLKEELKEVVNKNIPIRILTGNYLNITQPQALYMLKNIMGDKVDLRFYNIPNKSFHPKAYIFEYEKDGDLYVGSSNISRSALTSGIEWNYRLNKDKNIDDFNSFKSTFEDLFLNHSTIIDEEEMRKYSESWVRPKVYKHIDNNENVSLKKDNNLIELYEPRGAQIEALYELKKKREEGYDKGLVVAATGIGKTYLAAFDSKDYNRILFVAHRAEIINQAAVSFKNVRPDKSIGFFYSNNKDNTSDFIFATVQTLGKPEYLNDKYFAKDAFDYIVIDEFHHAAAGNYKNIIDYFQPKFMLGLTATPERLDNKDVFALCDNNVAYEVRLKSAINKGWLVPFRYYGIYDELVNYKTIDYKNGKYDNNQLEKALMINKRADLIIEHYSKYKSERALGFCSSRKHAEFMAEYFCSKGVKACAVVSEGSSDCSVDRNEVVNKLGKGEIKVIFSVDMFNEGLDIPSIDLVMFLRPTQSPTVFLQQLGRGLRKYKGKNYLNVLDFIGNYKKANLVPLFLTGEPKTSSGSKIIPNEEDYPEDCFVDFDFRLIDIFKREDQKEKKLQDLVKEEYYRIKEDLGYRPSRVELITYIENDIYYKVAKVTSKNPFRNYFKFLKDIGELEEDEVAIIGTKAEKFINMIEKTRMTKTYKMPVFLAFYNGGKLKIRINEEDIYISFKNFYAKGSNAVDLIEQENSEGIKERDKKSWYELAKNQPLTHLADTERKFFYFDGEDYCLNEALEEFRSNEVFMRNFKDAVDLRTREYYKNRVENKKK
ncbi:DEAD/DEAH box helicase family protein [Clostridium autoethanogenum]|uniref:DEAD/DEAH box helicase family protein n=1 Tax=Clostridium autoethanogenum DSM 10061 TaxID=1341692 RepID=A0ABM5NZ15_9CLOT|nr:DEAD/DEAH box helicase family protein [Clostridium autoethanogenum]AGY77760.1 DEAD/DEAH box helicase family protein [Clostridium autoethanogenum DSM 10061]ALU37896.1 putative type III restriction protein [Clostridium autoethanogenum DSM 10061]OVY49753.1 UvrABC system protein B [Clostridium autoethanogenum]